MVPAFKLQDVGVSHLFMYVCIGENVNKVITQYFASYASLLVSFIHIVCRSAATCSCRVINNWVPLFRVNTERGGALRSTDGFPLFRNRYFASRTVLEFGGYENSFEKSNHILNKERDFLRITSSICYGV